MSSKDVNAETDKGIPKLRFPEFLGQSLHDVQLGDVTEEASTRNGGKLTAASVMGVRKEGGIVPMEERLVAGNISRYKLVRSNWFAYNPMRLNIGSIARWQGGDEILVSPDYVVFRCSTRAEPTPIVPEYLDHFRSSRQWEAFTNESGDGGVRIRIYYRDLARMRLLLPSAIEQHKIADCLSSIDALIAAEADKLEVLKDHKKGLMQQLFPGPGQTTPRLRFPEFQRAEGWKDTLMGSVIEEFRSKSTVQDEYEVLTSARYGIIRQRDYYDNSRITDRNNIGFNIIPPGYMTYRSRSDDRKFFFNENNLGIHGIVSTYYPVFRVSRGSNRFLIELLSHFSELVGKVSVGTSQTVLSLNELRRLRLPIPTGAEQDKIAECFSTVNSVIAAQNEKVEALVRHKQGLMQQIIPVANEVHS